MHTLLRKFVLVAGTMFGFIAPAHAITVTDLLGGGTYTQDHLIFSNFTLSYDPTNVGSMIEVGAFTVNCFTDANGTGIVFGGSFSPGLAGQSFAMTLGYSVTTTSPAFSITGVNPQYHAGFGSTSFGAMGTFSMVDDLSISAGAVTLSDGPWDTAATFEGQTSVSSQLQMQITTSADYNGHFSQSVDNPSQTFTVIPEPTSAMLVLFGAGLVGYRIRRRY